MLLYEHPLSSYVQKVKIALREKGVPFDLELPAGLGSGSATGPFVEASPRAEVPALIDGNVRIFDSTIILEYIEEKWPTPPLLPKEPALRAKGRMIEDMGDTHYEALNWGLGEIQWFKRAEGALAETLRKAAGEQTAKIQAWLEAELGGNDYFLGDSFGWADLSAAPYVNRSVYYGFGPAAGSALARWLERIRIRPSVAQTFAEYEGAIATMGDGAKRIAAGMRREYRDHRLEWMIKSGGMEVVLAGIDKNNIRFSWP